MEQAEMQIALQLMMGVGLAACAGLRAWLPLLCVGLLARTGHLPLNPSYAFLVRTDVLTVLGVAALIELLGDKIVGVDHMLDAFSTLARPIAGTLLAASVSTHSDPAITTILGLILGGGTALTIHTGKAAIRAHSTALVPLHGGIGNAALSFGEDAVSLCGIGIAIWLPILAFVLTISALGICVVLIRAAIRQGSKLFAKRSNRSKPAVIPPA